MSNSSKYYDNLAAQVVLGNLVLHPTEVLSADSMYPLSSRDFVPTFHKAMFGGLYNFAMTGRDATDVTAFEEFLKDYPDLWGSYSSSDGPRFLEECVYSAKNGGFKYYYDKLKKLTLLREYNAIGVDVSWLYDDDNLIDKDKKTEQTLHFENSSISDLAKEIEDRVLLVGTKVATGADDSSVSLGDSIFETLHRLEETPEIGMPFSFSDREGGVFSGIMNRVTFGARKGKFFLRSAPSGVGKTRAMLSDACMLACKHIYINGQWTPIIANDGPRAVREGVLFISTELDVEELQTMALAFLTGINEEKIISRQYTEEEQDRIMFAAKELHEAPLRIVQLPNFTVNDIENEIRRAHILHKCNYIFYDYLGTSLGILEEIGQRTRGVSMREDSILFLLATRLKELAIQYNIFIESATQLNAGWKTDTIPDQNLLRGAKSISDRIDLGGILLNATSDDIADLTTAGWISKWGGLIPNQKLSIYKNRRGKYVNCYIWICADKGTCRFVPIGATTWNLEPYEVPPLPLEALARTAREEKK